MGWCRILLSPDDLARLPPEARIGFEKMNADADRYHDSAKADRREAKEDWNQDERPL